MFIVIFDPVTRAVYTVAERDVLVVPKGMMKEAVNRNLAEEKFPVDPPHCLYQAGAFSPNQAKIDAEKAAADQAAAAMAAKKADVASKLKISVDDLDELKDVVRTDKKDNLGVSA